MSDSHGASGAERALLDYLDGLLHDADEMPEPAVVIREAATNVTPLPSARPTRVVEPLKTFSEPLPFAEPARLRMSLPPLAEPPRVEVHVETKVPPVVEAPAVVVETLAPIEPHRVVTPATKIEVPAIAESVVEIVETPVVAPVNGRPQWAEQPFECLLFKAGGLTLAVPLVELGSIYPLEDGDITEIFGQIDWFLGLMRTKYGNVRVVDSAKVVMPERYSDEMAAGYRYVLTLNGSDWGLGIDSIGGTAKLDPESVKWRTERSKRPWLAGTVVEQMCALLDVGQMQAMFDQMDRKRGGLVPPPSS